MNIYETEGDETIVNLPAAVRELKGVGALSGDSARKMAIAELQTAALLDIALSLRAVAADARLGLVDAAVEPESDEPEGERDFFIEGDLVVAPGMDEPGEIKGFGQSEGDIYATVLFAGGAESRVWISDLTRLVGDERDDAAMQTASEAEKGADIEVEPEPTGADLVDDIDNDFDGDSHTAAASALDVLKANEAERKAAKKKGSKK